MSDGGHTDGAKKKFVYYPGCSSQGSAKHLDESLRAIIPELGLEMEVMSDWNCCGASVGNIGGGRLPTTALSGRNLAKAQQQQATDVLTGCAACYLNTHGANERIKADLALRHKVNESLSVADLSYEDNLQVRHACEVIVNDAGIDAIKQRTSNPLEGLKVAGYVGCQTVRPYANTPSGGNFDTCDNPQFLDQFTEACGAQAVDFDLKTSCCGGSIAVISPEKTLHLIKDILQAAADAGADLISTPCPLCLTNVEMYQTEINKQYGTDFNIPIVFYSQLMAKAFGLDGKKAAALHRNTVRSKQLDDMV